MNLDACHAGVWKELAPGIARLTGNNPSPFTGPGTNTYIVGHKRWAIIDPGPLDNKHIQRLLDKAAELNAVISDILVTHTHSDHSPAAIALKEKTNASLYGLFPPKDAWQDTTFIPDIEPDDRQWLDVGDIPIQAIYTPGHVNNHICYLTKEPACLIAGDHLINGTTVVIAPPSGCMISYMASLTACAALKPEFIAPGHGAIMPEAIEILEKTYLHRQARELKVICALSNSALQDSAMKNGVIENSSNENKEILLSQLLSDVYSDTPVFLHPLAEKSLLAHLIKLEHEGKAISRNDQSIWQAC